MIFNRPSEGFVYKSENALFAENAALNVGLKNPNQFREAVIYSHLSHMEPQKILSFSRSAEARAMIEAGYITPDTLDRLVNAQGGDNGTMKVTVCHMAKENGDELWDELLRVRAEERRIMNELLDKYSSDAEPYAKNVQTDIIDKCIPSTFR